MLLMLTNFSISPAFQTLTMSDVSVILLAWVIEALLGYPDWLYSKIKHPVVWIGAVITWLTNQLNTPTASHQLRYISGAFTSLLVVASAIITAISVHCALDLVPAGWLLEALLMSSLIASRSLYDHVLDVARPLKRCDLVGARAAVSKIVGRDPTQLDEAAVARASLETLAENASDGVVAPIFWGCLFGLPGLAGYKAINTLDSMIGHRTTEFSAFGGFAARLDDAANIIPARMTGLLFVFASGRWRSLAIMFRDAGSHRSPNAGWPEAAAAGALGVRLSGPRHYGDGIAAEPWLNAEAPDPDVNTVVLAARLYIRALLILALGLAVSIGTVYDGS